MVIPNILATRYASAEMVELFDAESRVKLERELWLAVLTAQAELGVDVKPGAIEAYRRAIDVVDFESIERRERVTRHDVKARLEEFNALAGYEEIHRGLTSRDVTENVEQLITYRALALVEQRTVAMLARLAEWAHRLAEDVIVGRTHNVPAQPTTVGKRFAQLGEELLAAHGDLESVRSGFSARGIKGPVGSQQDQLDLLGTPDRVEQLERRVAEQLGLPATMNAVGQVYPRSRDFAVVSALTGLAAAPANLALMVRLMAGHDLATEGFREGQVGSSAMPHKMNTRSCERITGLQVILRGHLAMAAGLSGEQWNEGDVSCSVVRRVVLPDAFFALDGLYETAFAVLNDFGIFRGVIRSEVERYGPFLATTALLLHAVRQGLGREEAHAIISEHAVATALSLREGQSDGSELLRRLGDDPGFPGQTDELRAITEEIGAASATIKNQVDLFGATVADLVADRPETRYVGADIL